MGAPYFRFCGRIRDAFITILSVDSIERKQGIIAHIMILHALNKSVTS